MDDESLPHVLKEQVLRLIDDIKELVPVEKQTVWLVVKYFFMGLDDDSLVQHIINTVLPHKEKIVNKDENFFMGDKGVFVNLPEKEVNYVRNMVSKNGFLMPSEKAAIWDYFTIFVTIAEACKKKK